ncbi:hypothetical protein GJAV_G00237870 [Gymnothorax javanicus]|nr:hypothetical protein GJAV_G00237870 [Gymnothorax javanicus]
MVKVIASANCHSYIAVFVKRNLVSQNKYDGKLKKAYQQNADLQYSHHHFLWHIATATTVHALNCRHHIAPHGRFERHVHVTCYCLTFIGKYLPLEFSRGKIFLHKRFVDRPAGVPRNAHGHGSGIQKEGDGS